MRRAPPRRFASGRFDAPRHARGCQARHPLAAHAEGHCDGRQKAGQSGSTTQYPKHILDSNID
jgi:hypothetical protein